jgi:hypothetical protein
MDGRHTAAVAICDLTQAGRKDFWIKGAGMQIGSGLAGLKNRAHGSVVTIKVFLFPTRIVSFSTHLSAGSKIILNRCYQRDKAHAALAGKYGRAYPVFPSEVLLPETDDWPDGLAKNKSL